MFASQSCGDVYTFLAEIYVVLFKYGILPLWIYTYPDYIFCSK